MRLELEVNEEKRAKGIFVQEPQRPAETYDDVGVGKLSPLILGFLISQKLVYHSRAGCQSLSLFFPFRFVFF